MRRLALAVCVTLLAVLQPALAAAPERIALVIGNGAYRAVNPLRNPDTDARLMAATLRRLGFQLVGGGAQLDLDRAGMETALRRFRAAIAPGSVAFFYYAGHGLQLDGTNYLVPVSAAPASAADVPPQMVAADLVLQSMADAGAGLNIVVLDACRNNPFAADAPDAARGLQLGKGAAAAMPAQPGLAEMHAPPSTLISFATQPGSVAFDGAAGAKDSPYTTALATALRVPGLDVVGAFNRAGLIVGRLTGQRQEPWLAISPLPDQIFLAGAGGGAALPAGLPREQPMRAPRAADMASDAAPPAPGALCPPAGLRALRDGGTQIAYEGNAPGDPATCVAEAGGAAQSLVMGIWPAAWPGAQTAAAAAQRVLRAGAGARERFRLSADVAGLRDTVTSETWQFTLTNDGPGSVMVGGRSRPVLRLRWDERNLARPYQGEAAISLDAATGAVLQQSFRVLSGGTAAAYDYWAPYAGGLSSVPDFRVTALR